MLKWSMFKSGSFKWVTHTLLLSIIPVLLFGTIIYQLGSRIVQDEIHRSSQESLSQVKYQVETKMKNIEEMTNQIALQQSIIDISHVGKEPNLGSYPKTNEIRNQLLKLKNVTDTVKSIYFYHIEQQIVISDDIVAGLNENRSFRDRSWLEDMQQMMELRQHQIWVSPREMISLNGEVTPVLTQIRLLPLFYNQAEAAIIVNLNPNFLVHTISSFPLGSDGKLIVLNEQNHLIAETASSRDESFEPEAYTPSRLQSFKPGETYTYRSGNQFLSVLRSERNGWIYIMAVPSNVPRQQVEDFGRIIIAITVILCLLVVYSAYFTHNRFQGSIRSLLERLSISKSEDELGANKGDAIVQIEKHVNRLLNEVKEGKSQQEIQLPLLRTHYLYALLHGNAVDISKLANRNEDEAFFLYDTFCVMVVQMDDSVSGSFAKERALFLFAVSNIATELSKLRQLEKCRIESVITYQHVVLIMNYKNEAVSEQEAAAIADQLRSIVKKVLKHSITIGVGTPASSAHDLSHSYREALQALQSNGIHARDEVLPFHNMTLIAEKLAQYPSAEEQELLQALRTRDIELAMSSLAHFRSMLESHLTSFHMAKTFYLQLVVAVIRLVQEYEEDISHVFQGENPYEEFFRMEELQQIHEWFEVRLINSILIYMDSVKRQRTEHVIKNTVKLIHEKYQNDLSLQVAAEDIGISASYLSQLFKDELGVTFIDYVTTVRVEHAKKLLEETSLTLQQIADAIGYTSVQQLFRVFKKRHGMTPGEYRDKHTHRLEKDSNDDYD